MLDQVPIDIDDWADENGFDQTSVMTLIGPGQGAGPDADQDTDGFGDPYDLCPCVPSTQVHGGTLEQFDSMGGPLVSPGANDGVGMECQCGETQNDGQVVLVDVDAPRAALLDPDAGLLLDADTKPAATRSARCSTRSIGQRICRSTATSTTSSS